MHRHRHRMSVSKKLLLFFVVVSVVLSAVTVVYAFVSDGSYSSGVSSLVTLTVEWIGGTIFAAKWYYRKAGAENNNKYAQEWAERMMKAEDVTPEKMDAAIRMTETVTRWNE